MLNVGVAATRRAVNQLLSYLFLWVLFPLDHDVSWLFAPIWSYSNARKAHFSVDSVFQEYQLIFYECSAASGHNVAESMVSLIRWGLCLYFVSCPEFHGLPPAFFTRKCWHLTVTTASVSPYAMESSQSSTCMARMSWGGAVRCHLDVQHCKGMKETLLRMLLISSWVAWNQFCLWLDLGWHFQQSLQFSQRAELEGSQLLSLHWVPLPMLVLKNIITMQNMGESTWLTNFLIAQVTQSSWRSIEK